MKNKIQLLLSFTLLSALSFPAHAITLAEATIIAQEEADAATATATAAAAAAVAEQEIRDSIFALDDANSITKNTTTPVTGNVTSNDGGAQTAILTSQAATDYGSLAFLSDGSYTYTLNNEADAIVALETGESLNDLFTYQIVGEHFYTSTAVLTIQILGQTIVEGALDETFYAFDDENSIIKNSDTITGDVTSNDVGAITYSLQSEPVSNYGDLTFLSDGSYSYRLNNDASAVQGLQLGEFLTDVFTYNMLGIDKSVSADIIIRIIGKTGSLTDEEDAAQAAAEAAKEEELKSFFIVDDFFSIIKSDNDETTATVTGNVLANDSLVKSVSLNGLAVGLYGILLFDNNGNFTYTLNTQSVSVQQLTNTGYLDDVFTYTGHGVSASTGEALTTTGTLTIRILTTSWSRDQNVEIEPNDTTISSTQVNSGQLIKGHLQTSDDKDIYKIQSSGNEIIHIELCPQGEICEKIGAWALYVFDGDLFPLEEFNGIIVKRFVTDGSLAYVNNNNLLSIHQDESTACTNPNATLPNSSNTCNKVVASGTDDHMYLVTKGGGYDASLIGVIDPNFGEANSVDIGVGPGAKTYYVAISSVLVGDGGDDGGGKLLHERPGATEQGPSKDDANVSADKETTEQFAVVFPANRDQYSISITSTGVNPLQSTRTLATTFNPSTRVLLIPEIQVGDTSYSAELGLQSNNKRSGGFKFDLLNMAKIEEELKSNIPATYDPITNRVRIPKYVDDYGVIYSVDLLYHPAQSGQGAYLELIKMDIIE